MVPPGVLLRGFCQAAALAAHRASAHASTNSLRDWGSKYVGAVVATMPVVRPIYPHDANKRSDEVRGQGVGFPQDVGA